MSKKSKKPTEPVKLVFSYPKKSDWEHEYRVSIFDSKTKDYYGYPSEEQVFSTYFMAEATCCGFDVIGDFVFENPALLSKYIDEVGAGLLKALKKYGRPYFSAYVPDTKEYESVRKVLEIAGFKPMISVPSAHAKGRYTNTRWEWVSPIKAKNAKVIRTIPV